MPPLAGPSVMLYWTRYPVNTSISPLSIWTGHETVICRFGCVRIFQIPGSRLRILAAPSNSCSMALKIDPFVAIQAPRAEECRRKSRATLACGAEASQFGRYNGRDEGSCGYREAAMGTRHASTRPLQGRRALVRLHDDFGPPDTAPLHP